MEILLTGKWSIYEDVRDQIARYIQLGVYKPGERLPSVRALAMKLGINPNTVERSYTELERMGLIRTIPKKGVFVRKSTHDPVYETARSQVAAMREVGLTLSQIIEIIHEVYGTEEGQKEGEEEEEEA